MRHATIFAIAVAALHCFSISAQTGEWAWMGGSNTGNQVGVYGTLGAPAAGNVPEGRYSAVSWTDPSGNFWLFGGYGMDANGNAGNLNDLWKYTPSTGQWVWTSGSENANRSGVYGSLGMPAAGNAPGGRDLAVGWTDFSGNLWMFGGSDAYQGPMNDLWKYAPARGEWAWMGGSNTGNQTGVYGTLGVPAPGNIPEGREAASGWTDASGDFWLFGGFGAVGEYLNDLWKYTPSTGQWTWMSGSESFNQTSVFGTLGVAAPGNVPGGRDQAVSWIDLSGNLWLFGGLGVNGGAYSVDLNDLWMYTPSTGEWTWMGGSNTPDSPGTYGTLGVPTAGNIPGARAQSLGWTDPSGNLWLFGGYGFDSIGNLGDLNDLWKYAPANGEWTWTGGSDELASIPEGNGHPGVTALGELGIYGALDTPAPDNVPGGRRSAVSWSDASGSFWLFGGFGFDANSFYYSLNDLWKNSSVSTPAAGEPTFTPPAGTYTSAQSVTISDPTAGATIYYTTNGSVPTTSSSIYTGPISVSLSETIEAIAAASGYSNSAVASATYTIDYPAAATPTFNPPAGTYTSTQSVTISDATPGAIIYYTTNGSVPSTSSSVYTGPISVSSSETIEAIAVVSGMSQSPVATASYTINLVPPSFTLRLSQDALTVNSGASGIDTLTVTPQNGFNSTVNLTCSGLPSGATCSFNPTTVTASGSAATAQMTITIPAQARLAGVGRPWIPNSTVVLATCFFVWRRRRSWLFCAFVASAALGVGCLSGCNAQLLRISIPQTSQVTVTATSGTEQQTASLMLTVN